MYTTASDLLPRSLKHIHVILACAVEIVKRMYVCVCFPFILDIKFVGRTSRGHTQEEGHIGLFVHLTSVGRAFIFLARRIQPFLSLVDREVEFCVLLTIQSFSTRWAFLFQFLVF